MSEDNQNVETSHEAVPADSETAKALVEAEVKDGDIITTDSGESILLKSTSPSNVFDKPQSKTPASCGRVVHVYSNRWVGPRPALVIQAWGVSSTYQLINASVFLDGANDSRAASALTGDPKTTVLPVSSIGLYDPLDPVERGQLLAGPGASNSNNPTRIHAEWMPYQAGQAQQTKNVAGPIADQVSRLNAAFTEYLRNYEHTSTNPSFADSLIAKLNG